MKKKYFAIAFSLVITANLPFVHGQKALSLDDCRRLAIENNRNLKIATEQERVAYYQKKEAFSKYLPEFSAMGAYVRLQHTMNLFPESVTLPPIGSLPSITLPIPEDLGEIDVRNIYVGSLSLTQPLFMGGRIVAYNDIRKNAELLAKAQKDSKLQDVISDLDAAYWQVISLSWKQALAKSYTDLLKKMDSDVDVMVKEGVATKADYLTVNVKLNEAEMALTKVENGLSLSRMLLNQMCGLDISEPNKLVDENREIAVDESAEPTVLNMEEALNNRPEIQSLQLATKIYKGKEKVALAEFLPQAGLRLGYTWTNPNFERGFEKKFSGGWNAALFVKVPFSFGSGPNLNAAKAETIISQLQLEDAKQKIELQVNQSTYKLNEATKKLGATKKNMDKADENLRYATAGFEEGVITASDVLAAHTAWLQAHSEVIDASIDIKLCNVYLNKAMGRTLYQEEKENK